MRPDVAAEFSRATGLEKALTFRQFAEPLNPPPLADKNITLPQAVRLALQHDPRIQSALARVRVAEADANQARLLPNPILSVDLRFPQSAGANRVFETTLSGDLITLLQKPGLIGAADKRLRESASDALTTALDLINEVQEAYAAARSSEMEIDNALRRGEILQHLRTIAQARFDAGDTPRLDVLTLDAQIMQAQLDLSDLKILRVTQRLTLARLVDQPRAVGDWILSAWTAPETELLAPEAAYIDAALLHRPEIQSRVWELRALGNDMAVASFSPLVGSSIGAHAEKDPEWRVGPMLSTPVPLFDFGQGARSKVKAQQALAVHDLAQKQLEVIQDVRLAYATYLYSRQALAGAKDKLLPLQRQQLDDARTAYQSGLEDLATLLLAETALDLTYSKIIELQEKVTVAASRLQRASGAAAIARQVEAAAATQAAAASPSVNTSQPAMAPAENATSLPATGIEK